MWVAIGTLFGLTLLALSLGLSTIEVYTSLELSHIAGSLFGALITLGTCLCLGRHLLLPIRTELTTSEEWALAFVTGAAVLSSVVLLLGLCGLVFRSVFIGFGLSAVLSWIVRSRFIDGPIRHKLPSPPRIWVVALTLTTVIYGTLYLTTALAPDVSSDGISYHLGLLEPYQRIHRITPSPPSLYAMLSQGMEMVFLFAITCGDLSSAALVHLAFLVGLCSLLLSYGSRCCLPHVGVGAAMLVLANPVVGVDASSSYVDVSGACVAFATFYVLTLWRQKQSSLMLLLGGLLAGFCFAVKYSIAPAIVLAIGLVMHTLRNDKGRRIAKSLAVLLLGVCLAAGPWVIRNVAWYQNPLAPFFNRIFPNQHIHISFEDGFRETLRNWGNLASDWQVPIELTIGGLWLQGLFGPLFLFCPLAVLACRKPGGNRLLIAAILFALAFPANRGSRFLIPALPFVAMAMALALEKARPFLLAFVSIHVVSCLPPVAELYCNPGAWRINDLRWRAALGVEKRQSFLSRQLGDWRLIDFINNHTPQTAQIFALGGLSRAYLHRDVVVAYESALGETLRDSLWTSHFKDLGPRIQHRYAFPPTAVTAVKIRSRDDSGGKPLQWSISEVKILTPGGELPRNKTWLIEANPGLSLTQLAFDGNPATRWKTWEPVRSSQYLQVRLKSTALIDGVVLETAVEHALIIPEITALVNDQWVVLARECKTSETAVHPYIRRAGMDYLRNSGFTHIVVNKEDFLDTDLHNNWWQWGIDEIGEFGEWRLFAIK